MLIRYTSIHQSDTGARHGHRAQAARRHSGRLAALRALLIALRAAPRGCLGVAPTGRLESLLLLLRRKILILRLFALRLILIRDDALDWLHRADLRHARVTVFDLALVGLEA